MIAEWVRNPDRALERGARDTIYVQTARLFRIPPVALDANTIFCYFSQIFG